LFRSYSKQQLAEAQQQLTALQQQLAEIDTAQEQMQQQLVENEQQVAALHRSACLSLSTARQSSSWSRGKCGSNVRK